MESDLKIKSKNIETYAEDMASAIETGEEGLVKKIIHEQEKQEEEKKSLSPESQKNKVFMIVGATLIGFGLVALAFLIMVKKNIETVAVERQFVPIIFTDQTDFLEVSDLDKREIAESIKSKTRTSTVEDRAVEGVYLTEHKKVVGLKRFLALLESNFPVAGLGLVKDNFFIGIWGQETKGDLFILLQVRSFTDIFPVLHVWEEKMLADLFRTFGLELTAETNYLLTANFTDGFVENKNARILYDQTGKVVLLYAFVDDTSVVIANSLPAAREAIFRLSAGKVRK